MKPYARLLGTAAVVVALDQVTKSLALNALRDGPIDVIPGFLTLRITYNSGGAFGILQGAPLLFLVATIAVMVGILMWAGRIEEPHWLWPFGLVLGGGFGNVADRIFREPGGEVVDFIDVHAGSFGWPLFNVADMAIVTGIGIILLLSARERGEEDGGSPP